MLTNEINVVYIDDDIQTQLSTYLEEYSKLDNLNMSVSYAEICFNGNMKYEDLLNNEIVKKANLIIIDSKLFKNSTVKKCKFSGEEFKLLLKIINPYIKVIIITQNELPDIKNVKKYYPSKKNRYSAAKDYYDEALKPIIEEKINEIKENRIIANEWNGNRKKENNVLIDKINNLLSGIPEYNDLSKQDVDDLINNFKKIEEILKEQKK